MCELCHLRLRLAMLAKERDDREHKKEPWISVSKGLPEPFESVLLYMPGNAPYPTIHEGYYAHGGFYTSVMYEGSPVTHWMPMPEAPKEDKT